MPLRPIDHDDALWHQALDHVLAVGAAPQDEACRKRAEAWCAADPAHAIAFQEAEKIWRLAGDARPAHAAMWQQRRTAGQPATTQHLTRRGVMFGGAALAAAVTGVTFLTPLGYHLRGAETTGTRETRVVTLPDGSRLTLGPDSVAFIRFTELHRRIELVEGIAYFDVTTDTARPFEVLTLDVVVRAIGTAFEVKQIACKVAIAVTEGRVKVISPDVDSSFGEGLAAGNWMVVDTGTGAVESGRGDATAFAAWRDGLVIVDDRPISDLVVEIGRWYPGAIFILDDELGRRRISGTLDLHEPQAALAAILSLYGGHVEQVTPWALFLTAKR